MKRALAPDEMFDAVTLRQERHGLYPCRAEGCARILASRKAREMHHINAHTGLAPADFIWNRHFQDLGGRASKHRRILYRAPPGCVLAADICRAYGISEGTVYKWTGHYAFPPPIRGEYPGAWEAEAVEAWVAQWRPQRMEKSEAE